MTQEPPGPLDRSATILHAAPAAFPDPDDLDDVAAPAGLFGAPATPDAGTFRPVPYVTIDGLDVATGPTAAGPAGLIVVDGLTITQGREDILDQPEPATGRLSLFDPTKTWATSQDLRGRPITLRWEADLPGSPRQVLVFFRGRIGAPIQVRKKTVTYPDGRTVTGSLVELPLQSVLVDAANRFPTDAWPAETLEARRSRVDNALEGIVDYVHTREYWGTPQVGPVTADSQRSLLDHVTALYDSCGADRMTYLPATNGTEYVPRRDYPNVRGLAQLWWEIGTQTNEARAGQGAYLRSLSLFPSGANVAGLPTYLDGDALGYDQKNGLTRPAKISRVQVRHVDAGTNYGDRTVELMVGGASEATTGVRTVRLESLVAWNSWADLAASDLERMVREEGSSWRLEPLTLSTSRTGGLEHINQALLLLQGGETNSLVFLQRTPLPEYGLRPIFGVMGSTITYRAGGWDVEYSVAPVTTATPQHAVTWEEIDSGGAGYTLVWSDGVNPRGLHESVTYEDMAFCAYGLAVTGGAGPDTGWDTYQS